MESSTSPPLHHDRQAMRIVVIAEHYYPRIGGAERVSQAIAEAAAQTGWESHVFTTGEGGRIDQINNVSVHRFDIAGNSVKGIKGDPGAIKDRLASIAPATIIVYAFQTWGSDIILANPDIVPPYSRIIAIPCGLSALSTLTRRILYWPYLMTLRRRWRRFDHYVFHTREGNDYHFLSDLVGKRSSIVPNFVPGDILGWSKTRAVDYFHQQGYSQLLQYPFVLNVSNHYRIKGHAALVRKFLRCFPDNWRLVIAGTGAEGGRSCLASCSKMAAREKRVILLDGADRQLILSLYYLASLFFLSSRIEYCPLVLLEAQAAGLPFLSFPVGNARQLAGGIVVQPRDVTRHFILDLLAEPTKLEELGERGRIQSLAEHSERRVTEEYIRLIDTIGSGPGHQ